MAGKSREMEARGADEHAEPLLSSSLVWTTYRPSRLTLRCIYGVPHALIQPIFRPSSVILSFGWSTGISAKRAAPPSPGTLIDLELPRIRHRGGPLPSFPITENRIDPRRSGSNRPLRAPPFISDYKIAITQTPPLRLMAGPTIGHGVQRKPTKGRNLISACFLGTFPF